MPRPLKRRKTQTYTRDIEHLSRLRMSIQLDKGIDRELAKKAIAAIDACTEALAEIIPPDALVDDDADESSSMQDTGS